MYSFYVHKRIRNQYDTLMNTESALQKLLTEDLHLLELTAISDDPIEYNPIEAPIKGTKCIIYHPEDSKTFAIIEITRNHKTLPHGPYNPTPGSNVYQKDKILLIQD